MPVTSLHKPQFPLISGCLALCTVLLLAGCTTNKVSPATIALQAELEARELQLQKEQSTLEERRERLEKRADKVKSQNQKNKDDSKRLSAKERQFEQRMAADKQPAAAQKSSTPAEKAVANMLLLGATEKVALNPPNIKLTGRIDTGAKRCMLGVFDLAEFERDGEPHVRFFILPEKGADKIEVTRPIKEHTRFSELNSNGKKRPVVMLRVELGSIDEQVEFVLVENSKADASAVSIGRNLLRDLAVVDVSKSMLIKDKAE